MSDVWRDFIVIVLGQMKGDTNIWIYSLVRVMLREKKYYVFEN